jgi:S1-C subfamily serine protease
VVGTDTATDLALVQVQASGLPVAPWGDSSRARVGEWVVAIGAPFGLDYTVTAGVLSATGRGIGANEIEDYLQTDASINPGNSGGPLVNLRGEILGINTMIIGRGTGIGFAIPSDMAHLVADQLIQHGVVRRAFVGVGFQELTPELAGHFGTRGQNGALVNHVETNGPAAQAGIHEGDVILSVDGNAIADGRDLLRQVIRRPIGATVRIGVVRDGRRRTFDVTTAERPNAQPNRPAVAPAPPRPARGHGAQLTPLTPQIRRQIRYQGRGDVVVSRVQPGSAADRAGLRPGDVILRADQKPVDHPRMVDEALRGDHEALLTVQRRDRRFFTVLETR